MLVYQRVSKSPIFGVSLIRHGTMTTKSIPRWRQESVPAGAPRGFTLDVLRIATLVGGILVIILVIIWLMLMVNVNG